MSVPPELASVLLVDDRPENLVALEAVLEPLGQRLVSVTSGTAALRELLRDEFACVLLDVQMPELDGFEVAELIKQRRRSEHIPIIFVTALSKETKHVFRGYSAGAVDYIFKPIDPDVLRSKVSVFVELWQKNRQLQEQDRQLHEQELERLEQASQERRERLADAMPHIVWSADGDGATTYLNQRWFESTGLDEEAPGSLSWSAAVHPADLKAIAPRRKRSLRDGRPFEAEARFRSPDGSYRWHLVRTMPLHDAEGKVESWVGTATDIDDRRRGEDLRAFVAAAGEALGGSLDERQTLARVADVAVREFADFCAVHLLEQDTLVEVAVAHRDPAKAPLARELLERLHADGSTGAPAVVRTGEAELANDLELRPEDELMRALLDELTPRAAICVPLPSPQGVRGALTLVSADSGRRFGSEELLAAQEIARRAATAAENARLYREVSEQAQAARVLATIGDGVVLVDSGGRIRLWNAAAERITGAPEEEALGRTLADVLPGWETPSARVPVARSGEAAHVAQVPLEAGGRELWLSISAVGFEEGVVYAFRDLTEERALETMRHDMVATVSHELRTPLAAIYGAALTLRRSDLEMEEAMYRKLLEVIADESEKLADIVDDLLLASQLDAGKLSAHVERCDPLEIARLEVDAAQAHLPGNVELVLETGEGLPEVAADPGQLRQVLSNLIENAVKYSPAGGVVTVTIAAHGRTVRFSVADPGLGIPPEAQRRIFEKFYRLDPDMKHGIGGTGLGLYISSELVHRVDGRIWVESDGRSGSTFFVEIPCAAAAAAAPANGRRLRVASRR